MMGANIIAMILAGGRVNELSVLTLKRPKSAMPFGGLYRVIDCVLTNLSDTGISNIGILSQYRPYSLMNHVGSGAHWDLSGYKRGVRFLPPHTGARDSDWYKGTADAIYQNIDYIRSFYPEHVLILSGDHIYRMNYSEMIRLHKQRDADVTIALTPVSMDSASKFGQARMDSEFRVTTYAEKASPPISNLASMTVYLFKTEVLIRELTRSISQGKTYQIYRDLLPELAAKGRMFAYVFEGFWSYSRTIGDYFETNMRCLESGSGIDLWRWKLRTKYFGLNIGDYPPAHIGPAANVVNSIVSPGAVVSGTVRNSIISPLVTIAEGAEVNDSLLFDEVVVGEGSVVEHVIVDKKVRIGRNCKLGVRDRTGIAPNELSPAFIRSGITLIGRNARIPDSVVMGGNVLVFPDTDESQFHRKDMPDGAVVGVGE